MIRTIGLYRAQQSARLGTERDAQGRVWCQLFPLGTWHRQDFPGGKLELTPQLLNEFIDNWRAGGSPPLPVDYNHEEDGPAAGWIEDLRLSAAGELEGAIKWTDEAAEDIKADRRRFLSPTWAMQHVNRRTGTKGGPWLYGAALLNDPFYDSMPRVAASAAPPTTHQPPEALAGKDKHMDKKRICAALGLPEDTADEKVMEALEAACKTHASAGETEKLTAAVSAAVKPVEEKLAAVQAEAETLKASLLERDVEALCATAKLAGKPVEGMREFIASAAKRDGMEAAKKLVDALPVVISTQEKGVSGTSEKLTASVAVQQFEALVEEQLKAGAKSRDAYRIVSAAHPELSGLAFPSTTTSTTR